MRLMLTLLDGQEIEYQMVGHAVTIGRSNKCDLVISHEGMSRLHCKIEVRDGEVFITDLGSINGVYIDGKKIPANSSVPFQTYLHLAFGFVQSAQFFVDEVTRLGIVKPADLKLQAQATSGPAAVVTNNTRTKTKATPAKQEPKTNPKTQKPADKEKKGLMVNLVAFVGILFALYYFLYADKKDNPSEIHASPSASPKKIETNDHF